jgi:hypothetical protein
MILIFQPGSASAKAVKTVNDNKKVQLKKTKKIAKKSAKAKPTAIEKPKKIVQVSLATPQDSEKTKTKKIKSPSAPAEKKVVELSFAGQGGDVGTEIEPLPPKAVKTNSDKNKKKSADAAGKSKVIEIKAKADEPVTPAQDPFFHKPEDARKVASTQKAKPADDIKLYEQFQKATEQEIDDDY